MTSSLVYAKDLNETHIKLIKDEIYASKKNKNKNINLNILTPHMVITYGPTISLYNGFQVKVKIQNNITNEKEYNDNFKEFCINLTDSIIRKDKNDVEEIKLNIRVSQSIRQIGLNRITVEKYVIEPYGEKNKIIYFDRNQIDLNKYKNVFDAFKEHICPGLYVQAVINPSIYYRDRKLEIIFNVQALMVFKEVSRLDLGEIRLGNNTECHICMETLGETNVFNTYCGHRFCVNCIKQLHGKNCPICRKPLKKHLCRVNNTGFLLTFGLNSRNFLKDT